MSTLIQCPNCNGRVVFAPDAALAVCEYCGYQMQRPRERGASAVSEARSGEGHLAEPIAVAVGDASIELVARGAALPTTLSQTIGSQRDDQETVTVQLLAGERELDAIELPLEQRKARGMPVAQMTIRVAADGAVRLEVREEGTTNSESADIGRAATTATTPAP